VGGDHVDRLVQVPVRGRDADAPASRVRIRRSVASFKQRSTITAYTNDVAARCHGRTP